MSKKINNKIKLSHAGNVVFHVGIKRIIGL